MYVTAFFLKFELVKQDKVTLYLGDIMNVLEVTGVDLKTLRGWGGGGGVGGGELFRGHQTLLCKFFFVPESSDGNLMEKRDEKPLMNKFKSKPYLFNVFYQNMGNLNFNSLTSIFLENRKE